MGMLQVEPRIWLMAMMPNAMAVMAAKVDKDIAEFRRGYAAE